MNVLDLFCGAGGLSYGFEQNGYKVLLGIDNDAMAVETFKKNHLNAKAICADITKIHYQQDIAPLLNGKKIDVIVGGPPCQGFSLSGSRNFEDPRNKLYLSYIRLVDEIQPKAFVIENVPGLVSLFNGEVKDHIIAVFEKMGYSVKYQVLLASEYGVPQNRRRVFFVGIKNKSEQFEFPSKNSSIVTSEMALSDLPPLNTDDLGSESQAYFSAPKNEYQKQMRENSQYVLNHIAAKHSEKIKGIIAQVPDGGNYKNLPKELQGSRNFHVAWTRFNSQKPAPTIDTGHRHHFHYRYNRVPTVRECARLQSFPDNFIFLGNKTQQFRQVGNAVPPLLASAVAKTLKNVLKEN